MTTGKTTEGMTWRAGETNTSAGGSGRNAGEKANLRKVTKGLKETETLTK
jgi:hypothetical protein